MKLIIQIPCYNEAETLPGTLAELPDAIPGVDEIKILIIDDGSTDRTRAVARENGVDYIVTHNVNKGLAKAFQSGISACLELGADIIVNTDADNQYPGRFIPDLIKPVLHNQADMVVGDRQVEDIEHFSPVKKFLQKAGSSVVRRVSGTQVPDAPSGFRAFSRHTAARFNIFSQYTYTLETLIQAGNQNLTITSIPIQTNSKTRESRLIRSIPQYIIRSAMTIIRIYMLYQPMRTFFFLSMPFFAVGAALWLRYAFILLVFNPQTSTNVQSIVVGAVLLIIGFVIFLIGIVGDLISVNRRINEEILYHLRLRQDSQVITRQQSVTQAEIIEIPKS